MIGLGFWTPPTPPPAGGSGTPSDATPAALGTGAPGASTDYSRADHVHDTTKAFIEGKLAAGSGVVKSVSNVLTAATIVNADVNAAAAIAYTKLTLTGSIVDADVNASAAIAYTKLSLAGSIVNADIGAAAAIAGSKVAPNFVAQNVTTTGYYTAGANGGSVATGQLRLTGGATSQIVIRNNAGSGDLNFLTTDGSNNQTVGSALSPQMNLLVNGATWILSGVNFMAASTMTAATIQQQSTGTASAVGKKFSVLAQTCTGTTSTGGDLEIGPGTGTSANGVLRLINIATTTTAPAAGGGSALPITPAGYVSVTIAGTARQIAYY